MQGPEPRWGSQSWEFRAGHITLRTERIRMKTIWEPVREVPKEKTTNTEFYGTPDLRSLAWVGSFTGQEKPMAETLFE